MCPPCFATKHHEVLETLAPIVETVVAQGLRRFRFWINSQVILTTWIQKRCVLQNLKFTQINPGRVRLARSSLLFDAACRPKMLHNVPSVFFVKIKFLDFLSVVARNPSCEQTLTYHATPKVRLRPTARCSCKSYRQAGLRWDVRHIWYVWYMLLGSKRSRSLEANQIESGD